jgi:hypothetical protein
MQIQFHAYGLELVQEGDEILQTAAETIDRPGHDDVEPPTNKVAAEAIKLGPLVPPLEPTDSIIGIDFDDLMPKALGGGPELEELVLRGLVESRDAEIEDCSHAQPYSQKRNTFQGRKMTALRRAEIILTY